MKARPNKPRGLGAIALTLSMAAMAASPSAHADMTWQWHYEGTAGEGISANGTLRTADAPDANGFYAILAIAGTRNGDAIVGLYPAGSAIPGNEPYAVDNRIRMGEAGQVTVEGFGYTLASGAHANPYFADFLSPPRYNEVFTQGGVFQESAVTFSATPVPEPSALALLASGIGALAIAAARRGRRAA